MEYYANCMLLFQGLDELKTESECRINEVIKHGNGVIVETANYAQDIIAQQLYSMQQQWQSFQDNLIKVIPL